MNEGQNFAEHKSFPRDTQGIALDARPEVVLCPNGARSFTDLNLPSLGAIFKEGKNMQGDDFRRPISSISFLHHFQPSEQT